MIDFASAAVAADPVRPPEPLSPAVGSGRHSRVRAMLRAEGVVGLVAVAHPEDMQAGDYLTGIGDGVVGGAIVCLPLEGEPFAFAPPDVTPQFPAMVLQAMEAAGIGLWVADWLFGSEGMPAFARRLRELVPAGTAVGGVNLTGTPLADYLRSEVPGLNLQDVTTAYNRVRAVNVGEEVACVRSAAATTEAAAQILTGNIAADVTEAEITGLVNAAIGRRGIMIGDVPLASFDGYGAPLAPASFRTIANVGNSFDSTWRSRGLPPRMLKRGALVSTAFSVWAAGTQADLQLTVSIGELAPERASAATRLNGALLRARDLIRPGISLSRLERHITGWLGTGPATGRPYAYLLNPSQASSAPWPYAAADVVLEEGMHVQINPRLSVDGAAMQVGSGLLVGPDGAELLNTIPCEVRTR